MRTTDEVKTEARRKTILKSAIKCFAEFGLQKASMQDICDASSMRSGHIYYYFKSRDAIIESVFEIGMDDLLGRIEHMLDRGDVVSAILKIQNQAEAMRREWNITPALWLEFGAEATRNERLRKKENETLRKVTQAITQAAERAIDAGRLDPRFKARSFALAVNVIWTGLRTLRVNKNNDIVAYEQAIALLLEPWTASSAFAPGRASRNRASVA